MPMDLAWLPALPSTIKINARSMADASAEELVAASRFALSYEQLRVLGRAFPKKNQSKELKPVRLGIISSFTTDLILDALKGSGLRHGLAINIHNTPFGSAIQEALSFEASLGTMEPDFVLLSLSAKEIGLRESPEDPEATISGAKKLLDQIVTSVKKSGTTQLLIETIVPPSDSLYGNGDLLNNSSLKYQINDINNFLRAEASKSAFALLDTAALAETIGLKAWHDPVMFHHAKLAFSLKAIPLYCERLCHAISSMLGRSKKVLVLDLDNTLWGGAIGDDGIEGIALGNGSGLGEAFLSVQRTALNLKKTGVLLAACSKNDEAVALDAIDNHPEMILSQRDFTTYQINWAEKSENLVKIAETLNLGLESFVFLDDNPGERARVRSLLPQVSVPEIGDDPALYAETLLAGGYFDRQSLSTEDLGRGQLYEREKVRKVTQSSFSSIDDYLNDLQMRLEYGPISPRNLVRVSQLINKTNQFNLTTVRRTQAEVLAISKSGNHTTFTARLSDKFGDMGLIAVAICEEKNSTWHLTNLLMSCRVLNRGVEAAFMNVIENQARKAGITQIVGQYFPTKRNEMVENLYENLGFECLSKSSVRSDWVTKLEASQPRKTFVDIKSSI